MYELESKSTIVSDMKELVDYAANFIGAFSRWWSPGSAAKRQLGDSGNNVIVAREEQQSMSNKIDTHGEFFGRSAQTMPFKIVASAIEPTRRVPVHVDNIFIPEYRQGGLPVPTRINRSVMRYLFCIHAVTVTVKIPPQQRTGRSQP